MSNSICLSVIIPTYNREKLLCRCLRSVASNISRDIEIIVVDDGSTDNSRELIINEFPDVKYFYQENKGVSAARNKGMQIAKGDLIALLDSDDIWSCTRLKKLKNIADKLPENVGLIFNDMDLIINNCGSGLSWSDDYFGILRDPVLGAMDGYLDFDIDGGLRIVYGNIYKLLINGNIIQPSCTLMRKKVFEKMGGFREDFRVANDSEYYLRVSKYFKIAYVPQILTSLGAPITLQSLSHNSNSIEKITNMISAINEHLDLNEVRCIDGILHKRNSQLYALLGYHYLSIFNKKAARANYFEAVKIQHWQLKYYGMLLASLLPTALLKFLWAAKRSLQGKNSNA